MIIVKIHDPFANVAKRSAQFVVDITISESLIIMHSLAQRQQVARNACCRFEWQVFFRGSFWLMND
jgi:hypothetical protein